MEINYLRTNRRAQIGNITIPLLKGEQGEQGEQGYSISRVERISGDGTAGTTDTYTIYINTVPESVLGTFQVTNGTGADMFKEVYDINDDGIVDKATADKEGNDIIQTYATKSALSEMATSFGNEIASNTLRIANLESAGYITKTVSDLTNYYNKTEIDTLVGDIESLLASI